ncbi:polysaccharide biosynthesis tyrosine autokinase [Pedobacter riviphilus]|uniref:non-specific protein-tyrosine kinase n=1 Tax=Pedobacter riviphilus TaxID=2766984 RepID=A0ABX6TL74_9SPHI|nr:polysaccharide biosynthesis tyrosine autokinase [Pedobacter riviphilus]QNR86283.1 polysaccharide biosynthesis tyrosine autokinase [Pedobacter riviphilus]
MLKQSSIGGANDFAETMTRFARNWHYFLISIIISMAAVYAFLYVTPPKYKVSSTLLISDDKNGAAMSNSTAFSDLNMFQTVKTVDNEIEILRSRDLIFKVLKKLNLETAYFKKEGIREKELYGKTSPLVVTAISLKNGAYGRKINVSYLDEISYIIQDSLKTNIVKYGDTINTKDYAIKIDKGPAYKTEFGKIRLQFKNLYKMTEAYNLTSLKIVPVVKDANTITISLNDVVPQRGIDILNDLIETYNINNVNNKNTIARNTIKFIDNRLKYLVADLSGTEEDVESYKQQNRVTDVNMDAQMNAARSGEYNQLLEASSVQLRLLQSIENYFKSKQSQFNLAPSAMGLKDPILNSLISKFNDLQLERNRMLRTANAENPLVLNLNEQIATLKTNILENLSSIKQGFVIERNNLSANYSQFDNKIKSVPTIERGLLERSREQSVKSGLYKYLLQKREETALSLSATVPTSQVVDKPAYNTTPDSPKQPLLYLCGFIFGFFVPAGVIYAKGFLNNKVQDASTIELTGAKMLGELSHNQDKSTIVFQKDNRSTISELFRYIRMNLGLMSNNIENKVMLVTSSMKGEGKTFFSVNLATTLGMLDKKVVILEFDLRKPDLLNKVGLKQTSGLTNYLIGESVFLEDIIMPTNVSDNIWVIGCGQSPENPAEVMMSPKMDLLFDELKERFDYIIIDTSPVGQVADAFSLAEYADVSIYLVRYNYTNKYQLAILKDICENNKLKNPMVVFNDAKREKSQKYSYGGYGYAMAN